MTDIDKTVIKHLGDLIAVERHCADALERQVKTASAKADSGIEEVLRHTQTVLAGQASALERRLQQLEGSAKWKEAISTVTGFLVGIYDKIRSETPSRMLRDDFAALHFVYVCQTMFVTTAQACGDPASADLVREHQLEIPPLILKIADCIPAVVVSDLERDGTPIVNRDAAETAVQTAHEAWRGASASA